MSVRGVSKSERVPVGRVLTFVWDRTIGVNLEGNEVMSARSGSWQDFKLAGFPNTCYCIERRHRTISDDRTLHPSGQIIYEPEKDWQQNGDRKVVKEEICFNRVKVLGYIRGICKIVLNMATRTVHAAEPLKQSWWSCPDGPKEGLKLAKAETFVRYGRKFKDITAWEMFDEKSWWTQTTEIWVDGFYFRMDEILDSMNWKCVR